MSADIIALVGGQPTLPRLPEGDRLELERLTAMYAAELSVLDTPPPDPEKVFATQQARAALAGYQLVRLPAGDYIIERWSMTRALCDAAAVAAFLRQVGAPE